MEKSNIVFIGKKPVNNYVLACMTLIKSGHNEVVIKARGRNISHAVNVVEVLRNRYLPDAEVADIKIGTESIKGGDGPTNVSTIDIHVKAKA